MDDMSDEDIEKLVDWILKPMIKAGIPETKRALWIGAYFVGNKCGRENKPIPLEKLDKRGREIALLEQKVMRLMLTK